jgi:hypothetical protein
MSPSCSRRCCSAARRALPAHLPAVEVVADGVAARGVLRRAAALPAARRRLAAGHGDARARRGPRRRHGARQDDPAHRTPAAARDRRSAPRRLPDLGGGQLGAGDRAGSRPTCRSPGSTARAPATLEDPSASWSRATGTLRRDTDVLAAVELGRRRARRGPAREEPHHRGRKAVRRLGRAGRRAHRHAAGEPSRELWSAARRHQPRAARQPRGVRAALRRPIERAATPSAAARLRGSSRRSSCGARRPTRRSSPTCPPKIERTVVCRSPPSRPSCTRRRSTDVLGDGLRSRRPRRWSAAAGSSRCSPSSSRSATTRRRRCAGSRPRAPRAAGRSGKLAACREIVAEATDAGEQVLVFTQYVEMGTCSCAARRRPRVDVPFLHGGSPRAPATGWSPPSRARGPTRPAGARREPAGGRHRLNLTAATHVIHYDRWWNPAVEDQATDRAHRIGQRRTVEVHKLVTAGTVEERVADLLEPSARWPTPSSAPASSGSPSSATTSCASSSPLAPARSSTRTPSTTRAVGRHRILPSRRPADERVGPSWRRWRGCSASDPRRAARFNQGRAFQRSGRVSDRPRGPRRRVGAGAGGPGDAVPRRGVVPPLDDDAWERVLETLAGQVRHTARLLAGHAPEGLEVDLAEAPGSGCSHPDELDVTCGCDDADMAVRARHRRCGRRSPSKLEDDPFVLLRLRGRGRERLLAELAAVRRRRVGRRGDRRRADRAARHGALDDRARSHRGPGRR